MQQAIDILDYMIENYSGINWVYHEVYDALEEAKSRIQVLGDGWIPVTERLPNEKEQVIVYQEWRDHWSINVIKVIKQDLTRPIFSHWMPLPLPPKI